MSNVVSEELKVAVYTGYLSKIDELTIYFKIRNGKLVKTTSNSLHHKKKMRRYLELVGFKMNLISGITDYRVLNGIVSAHIVDRLLVDASCKLDEFGNGKIVDIQEFNAHVHSGL